MSRPHEDPPFRDVAGAPNGPLDAEAWDQRWVDENTPWDMGQPTPPFVRALDDALVTPPARALVVGCGAGHDARLLAERGFDVTGIDLSETALECARLQADGAGVQVDFARADVLALPDSLGAFDLVVEHTCFCAIDPGRRDEYVESVHGALAPGGALLGLFFLIEREEGPPFGATEEEIRHRFAPRFEFEYVESPAVHSHPARAGSELLALLRRR